MSRLSLLVLLITLSFASIGSGQPWGAWNGHVGDKSAALVQRDQDFEGESRRAPSISLGCTITDGPGSRRVFKVEREIDVYSAGISLYPNKVVAATYRVPVRVKFDNRPVEVETWSVRGWLLLVPASFFDRLARAKEVKVEARTACYQCPPGSIVMRFKGDGLATALPVVRRACEALRRNLQTSERYTPKLK